MAPAYSIIGGLLGTLLTIPAAKFLGRRMMFAAYFVGSAAALFAAFGHRWDPITQLWMFFPIGVTVFGVFGACTYYSAGAFPHPSAGDRSGILL